MQSAAATGISATSAVSSEGRSVQQKEKKGKKTQKKTLQENSGKNRVGDLSKVSK